MDVDMLLHEVKSISVLEFIPYYPPKGWERYQFDSLYIVYPRCMKPDEI